MKNNSFQEILSTVAINSLLHLYMKVRSSERFTPRHRRNDILTKYLKPKLKLPEYKCIKPELKRLLLTGRNQDADLEAKLTELNGLYSRAVQNPNDVKNLFDMIELLKSEHGFNTELLNEAEPTQVEVIYILQDHIDHCFDENGALIAPISLHIESKRSIKLVNIITSIGLFLPELIEFNELKFQTHILLHPLNQRSETLVDLPNPN